MSSISRNVTILIGWFDCIIPHLLPWSSPCSWVCYQWLTPMMVTEIIISNNSISRLEIESLRGHRIVWTGAPARISRVSDVSSRVSPHWPMFTLHTCVLLPGLYLLDLATQCPLSTRYHISPKYKQSVRQIWILIHTLCAVKTPN